MLRPTSPRPPSGITRSAPSSKGAGSLRFSYKDFMMPVCHVGTALPASGDMLGRSVLSHLTRSEDAELLARAQMAVLHDVAAVREALRLGLVRDDEDG